MSPSVVEFPYEMDVPKSTLDEAISLVVQVIRAVIVLGVAVMLENVGAVPSAVIVAVSLSKLSVESSGSMYARVIVPAVGT